MGTVSIYQPLPPRIRQIHVRVPYGHKGIAVLKYIFRKIVSFLGLCHFVTLVTCTDPVSHSDALYSNVLSRAGHFRYF